MAAKIRRELNADVEMVQGAYGEYMVLVDGEKVIEGGALRTIGVLPSGRKIVEVVRRRLEGAGPP